jgi:hypothetical protein
MSKSNVKSKRTGTELSMRTLPGKDGRSYLVFRTGTGSFHTFVETEAKQAARDCGAAIEGTTRQMWSSIWK